MHICLHYLTFYATTITLECQLPISYYISMVASTKSLEKSFYQFSCIEMSHRFPFEPAIICHSSIAGKFGRSGALFRRRFIGFSAHFFTAATDLIFEKFEVVACLYYFYFRERLSRVHNRRS